MHTTCEKDMRKGIATTNFPDSHRVSFLKGVRSFVIIICDFRSVPNGSVRNLDSGNVPGCTANFDSRVNDYIHSIPLQPGSLTF
jgi:hypothetical protein